MKSVRQIISVIGLATGAIYGLCIGLFLKSFLYGALAAAIIAIFTFFFLGFNYCAHS